MGGKENGTGNSRNTLPKNRNNNSKNNNNNNNRSLQRAPDLQRPKGFERKKWNDMTELVNVRDLSHLVGKDTFSYQNNKIQWTGITKKKTHDILDCMLDPATVTAHDHLPINTGNSRRIKSSSGSLFLQSVDNGRYEPSTGFSSVLVLAQDPIYPLFISKKDGFAHYSTGNDEIAPDGVGANNGTIELAYSSGQGHGALRFRSQGTRNLDQYMSMSFPALDASTGKIVQVFRRLPGDTTSGEIYTYGSKVTSVTIKQWVDSASPPTNEFSAEIAPNPAVAQYVITPGINTSLIEKSSQYFSFENIQDSENGSGVLSFCLGSDTNLRSVGPYALIGSFPAELPTMITQVASIRNNATAVTCTYFPDHQYGGGSSLNFLMTGGAPPNSPWLDFGFAKNQKWFGRLWDGSHSMRFPSIEEVSFLDVTDFGKVPTTNPFQSQDSMISLTFMDYTPTIAMTLASIPMQVKLNCWLEGVSTNSAQGGELVNERSEAVKAILSAIAASALPSCNPSHEPFLAMIKKAADYIIHSDDTLPVALRKGLAEIATKGSNLVGTGLDKVSDIIKVL